MDRTAAVRPSEAPPARLDPRLVYPIAGAVLAVAILLAAARVGEREGALSDWQALVLGIVQGLTELLPISSSGHLMLVPWLGDWQYLETHPDFNKTFDVALHLGTLVAVVAYFWRDIVRYVAAWFASLRRRSVENADERIAWCIFAATIPAALAGAFGENLIEEHLGDPWQIAILLALFGALLWVADRQPADKATEDIGYRLALVIGVSQILSLMPGVSRSGITITAARFGGLGRDAAARFSFLLLVPITFGAVLYKGVERLVLNPLPPGWVGPFLVGTLAAGAVALVAIEVLLTYVRRRDYSVFVVYRLIAAAVIGLLIITGAREATF